MHECSPQNVRMGTARRKPKRQKKFQQEKRGDGLDKIGHTLRAR